MHARDLINFQRKRSNYVRTLKFITAGNVKNNGSFSEKINNRKGNTSCEVVEKNFLSF
ncbi:hypothetical protein PanWU01x14_241870 [Parasponia andersonii]|uniref:Uncharacterized protein n=1 Tax=Parasponia andersonii TaxID=3476 RepID=A0A2P5BGB2_PARAD|nr:hypothetical protein PanWU01x14_241870 [Parasponia andersonii]